jgi:glycosyltransferase involved in cell wall biosynthesis
MNNDIKVTIGIPTYNRVRELTFLLDSIMQQLTGPLSKRIEVLVSDDQSNNPARDLVLEYSAKYPGVFSYRYNTRNLGYSRNVDAVICEAKGEYVLLMGDDDALEANAMATLFDILDSHANLGVLILSETPYDSRLEVPLSDPKRQSERKGGVLYNPGLDYVRKNRIFTPALISGCVVNRAAWLKAGASDFYDTISVHRCCAMRIIVTQPIYVSNLPTIKYRTSGAGAEVWAKDPLWPFAFDLGDLACCRALGGVYPRRLHRYLHAQAMRSIIYFIMRQKVTSGQLNRGLLRAKLAEGAEKRYVLTWLALLLLRLPGWIICAPFKLVMFFR